MTETFYPPKYVKNKVIIPDDGMYVEDYLKAKYGSDTKFVHMHQMDEEHSQWGEETVCRWECEQEQVGVFAEQAASVIGIVCNVSHPHYVSYNKYAECTDKECSLCNTGHPHYVTENKSTVCTSKDCVLCNEEKRTYSLYERPSDCLVPGCGKAILVISITWMMKLNSYQLTKVKGSPCYTDEACYILVGEAVVSYHDKKIPIRFYLPTEIVKGMGNRSLNLH